MAGPGDQLQTPKWDFSNPRGGGDGLYPLSESFGVAEGQGGIIENVISADEGLREWLSWYLCIILCSPVKKRL